ESIKGSGLEGRVTKDDIVQYVRARKENKEDSKAVRNLNNEGIDKLSSTAKAHSPAIPVNASVENEVTTVSGDEIIEMDRMRKIIAEHMLNSVQTSAHVTSFAEADVTNIVNWRNKNKDIFHKREGTKI